MYYEHINDDFLAPLAHTLDMRLTRKQGDGIKALVRQSDAYLMHDSRQVAYMLASVWHESRFQPIMEIRADPIKSPKTYKAQNAYWHTGYFGRGFIQLTWRKNYAKFSPLVGVDLVKNPRLALDMEISAKVTVIGMKFGIFTGVGLDLYFQPGKPGRWYDSRRIVNGTDRAQLIADAAQSIWPLLRKFEV